ncbi:actin-like ATPase domain-containing protein [Wilcoxina mikolae CBS 423.85]|nr:actin-like ATPase domain-containing protein [Wilcoxina mikolae CBS 423.85]
MVGSVDSARHKFIVGVDFGTTFTSVAFAHTASPDEIKIVQTWPSGGTGSPSADQVPSEIHYTNPQTREKKWGYEVLNFKDADPLKWFKLLLQKPIETDNTPLGTVSATNPAPRAPRGMFSGLFGRHAGLSASFSPPTVTLAQKTSRMLEKLHIAPVTVVADFLSSVLEVTKASMERSYDSTWVRSSRVEYVLTIPAIWDDAARDLMVQAAEKAGFGKHRADFNLVNEPESAAAYTLQAIQPASLKRGDTFIVCDAGGGTVDLISYKVTDLDPLRLDESVPGGGDFCGSEFLNERFLEYIRGVLGDSIVDNMKLKPRREMMRTWEEKVKFTFGNHIDTEDNTYDVFVPGVLDNERARVQDNIHTMKTDDVRQIFDPVVDCIVELVQKQEAKVREKGEQVAAILLVGGFGSSEYLRKRLQDTLYGGQTLQVMQPVNARSAIVRGALLRGLEGSIVKERRARRFYGVPANTSFREAGPTGAQYLLPHNNGTWDLRWENADSAVKDHKFWQPLEEKWRVRSMWAWYITQGMIVGNTHSVTFDFCRAIKDPINPNDLKFRCELFSCDLREAPDFVWRNPRAGTKLCILPADLSHISHGRFKRKTNSRGVRYYSVDYEIRMTLVDEVLKFELLFEGVVCGEVRARFV